MKDAVVIDGKFYPRSEKVWQDQVLALAKIYEWQYYHTWRSTKSVEGFPDLVLLRKKRIIFAELKGPDHKKQRLSIHQEKWITNLKHAIKEVYVWRPQDWDEVKRVLN
jgi:hypothetical protein